MFIILFVRISSFIQFMKMAMPAPISYSTNNSKDHRPWSSIQWSEKERRLWIVVLFVGTTLQFSCRTTLSIAAVSIADEFKWDKAQMGLLLGAFFWGYPILQIPGGGLSDRVGGDRVIGVSALLWSALCLATPIVPYLFTTKEVILSAMIISRILQGLAQSPHYPSMSSLVGAKISPIKRGNTIGTLFAATGFGTLVNGFIGSLLLERYGWHSVFYLPGFLGLVWALFMLHFSRCSRQLAAHKAAAPWPQGRRRGSEGEVDDREALIPSESPPVDREPDRRARPFSCRTLISKVPFWALIVAHQCVDFTFFTALNWLPTYFTETYPGEKGWVFNVLPWILGTISSIASGWVGESMIKHGVSVTTTRKVTVGICFVGLAIPLYIVSHTHDYTVALCCMVAVVGAQAFSNGGISVNPQDIAPDHAGMVFGISNGLGGIQGFLATWIVGLILHNTHQWSIVFQLAGGIAIVGLVVFSLFGSGKAVM